MYMDNLFQELQSYGNNLEIPETEDKQNNAVNDIQLKKNNDIKRLLATSNAPETGDER